MDEKLLVSIITVVFNGEKYIEDTIKSVISQDYAKIEYIIIDGGSTDGTANIIEKYIDKIDVLVVGKDDGIYDAMNIGIKMSKGDIIGIINSDDYYAQNAVSLVVKAFEDKNTDIVFGDKVMIDECRSLRKRVSVELPDKLKNVNISIVHPTVFVKQAVYDNINYDKKYKICADRDMFYKAFNAEYNFYKINKVIAYMRCGGISSKPFAALNDQYNIRKKYLGFFSAIIFTLKYIGVFFRDKIILKLIPRISLTNKSWEKYKSL